MSENKNGNDSSKIVEEVIEYPPIMLENWKAGDKSIVPLGAIDTKRGWNHLYNQPSNMFGENYTLWKKHQEGWQGFHFYLISTTCEPTNEKYFTGKAKIEELIPQDKLAHLRQATQANGIGQDHGLPDLFLYNHKGEIQFLEIKKETDTIKVNQLLYLALIKSILCSHVGIVFLIEEGCEYQPKVYQLPIVTELREA
jgi:hypothetical protein